MPGYEKNKASRQWAPWLAATLLLVTGACTERPRGGQFEVSRVEARWANGQMRVSLGQRIQLSDEAQRALEHGVPLTIGVELVLRDARTQTRVDRHNTAYEIRYLPLSERFQLAEDGEGDIRTFPRLRHALAELGQLHLSFETGALPSGEYELLARSFLDKRKMPPPMRLPALFSARWQHESDWTSWPLDIEPGV